MALELSMQTELDAPLALCWDRLRDIDGLCARHDDDKLSFQRISGEGLASPGSLWEVGAEFAGQAHQGEMAVHAYAPPNHYALHGDFGIAKLDIRLTLSEVENARSLAAVQVIATPGSFQGQLLLTPLQMVQPMLQSKFEKRMSEALREMLDG